MHILFALLISIATSACSMENDLWQSTYRVDIPLNNIPKKSTLALIYQELTTIQQKITDNARHIPAEKREKISLLLASKTSLANFYYQLIENHPYDFNRKEVDSFINDYATNEPAIITAVHEIETIINNALNQNYADLSDAFSSVSMNNNDPLNDIINGLCKMGISTND